MELFHIKWLEENYGLNGIPKSLIEKTSTMELSLVSAGDDIKIWDFTNFVQEKQFNPHDQNINSVCWSSDNSFLASASVHTDDVVLTYTKNNETTTLTNQGGCLSVDVHDASRYMLIAGSDGLISVWDLKTKKKRKTYKGHKGPVTSAKFNKGSSYIASGSETGEIILHNVVTGQGCQPLIAPNIQAIKQVQYSHCKKSLLGSVSDDGSVNIWDCNKQQLVQSFGCHQAPATGISFSPVNEIFLMSVGLDKRFAFYDLDSKAVVKVINVESPLTSIDIKTDGYTVVIGSTRGMIYHYDLRNTSIPVKKAVAHRSSVQCLRFQKEQADVSTNKSGSQTSMQQIKQRQLPLSPKTNNSNNSKDISGQSSVEIKQEKLSINEDIFSPLREGYLEHSGGETECHGSVSFTKSLGLMSIPNGEGYAGGVFSPVNENASVGSNMSAGVSPLTMSSYPSADNRNSSGLMDRREIQTSTDFVQRRKTDQPKTNCATSDNIAQPKQVTFMSGDIDPYSFLVSSNSSSSSDAVSPELKHRRSASQHQVGISASPSLPSMPQGDSPGSVTGTSGGAIRQYHVTTPEGVNAQSSIVNTLENNSRVSRSSRQNSVIPDHMKPLAQVIRTIVREELNSFKCETKKELRAVVQEELNSFKSETQNMFRDETEEMVDQLHRDIINLQVEMLKQFQSHQAEMLALLEYYSVNGDLVSEVERLQEKVKRLTKNF